jgi:hypothetical protein
VVVVVAVVDLLVVVEVVVVAVGVSSNVSCLLCCTIDDGIVEHGDLGLGLLGPVWGADVFDHAGPGLAMPGQRFSSVTKSKLDMSDWVMTVELQSNLLAAAGTGGVAG